MVTFYLTVTKIVTIIYIVEGNYTSQHYEKEIMNTLLLKKIFKIASNVLFYTFIALCAVLVIVSLFMKKNADDALSFFGYQARIVQSDSMAKSELTDVSDYKIKSIPIKSLVFIQTVPEEESKAEEWFADLKVGDVLTFRYVYNGQVTITHRIVEIEEKATGGRILTLEGDNKNASTNLSQQILDTSLHFDLTNYNYTIGKVVGQSLFLGFSIYAINTPVGMLCMVIIPCLIIIIMEIIRIVNVLGEEKRKKATEISQEQQAEIKLLKQQLAELQANINTNTDSPIQNEEKTDPPSPTPTDEQEIKDEQE